MGVGSIPSLFRWERRNKTLERKLALVDAGRGKSQADTALGGTPERELKEREYTRG